MIIMNSFLFIDESWKAYKEMVINDVTSSPVIFKLARATFYAGVQTMIIAMRESQRTLPAASIAKYLLKLEKEMEAFLSNPEHFDLSKEERIKEERIKEEKGKQKT